jgi:hypothetical protein
VETYIGVKMLEAEPMTLGEARFNEKTTVKGLVNTPGYLVRYPDGYESWSPKAVFEAAYFGVSNRKAITDIDVANFLAVHATMRIADLGRFKQALNFVFQWGKYGMSTSDFRPETA